jgi:hypothetical protein
MGQGRRGSGPPIPGASSRSYFSPPLLSLTRSLGGGSVGGSRRAALQKEVAGGGRSSFGRWRRVAEVGFNGGGVLHGRPEVGKAAAHCMSSLGRRGALQGRLEVG